MSSGDDVKIAMAVAAKKKAESRAGGKFAAGNPRKSEWITIAAITSAAVAIIGLAAATQ